jgi:hypothetical protein
MFKENKIFGGIPDGEPVDSNNKLAYKDNKPMLEIKTTSKDSLVYKFNKNNAMEMVKDENGLPKIKEPMGKYNT